MPTPDPFANSNPITPTPTPPLSGQAHRDIDSFQTVDMNQNPDGRFPDGSTRKSAVLPADRNAQAGAPPYQTGK